VILRIDHLGADLVDQTPLVSSGVAKKYVGADLGAKHWNEPPGGALRGYTDGLRPGRRSGSSSARFQTVRA
jgi:hypothetical protein